MITATCVVSLSEHLLLLKLIYGSKVIWSLPKSKFLDFSSLSLNLAYYSDTHKLIRFVEEILVSYFTNKRQDLSLGPNQRPLNF